MLITGNDVTSVIARCLPLVTWWFTASAIDSREHFLSSVVFYLTLLSAFQGVPLGLSVQPKKSSKHCLHPAVSFSPTVINKLDTLFKHDKSFD